MNRTVIRGLVVSATAAAVSISAVAGVNAGGSEQTQEASSSARTMALPDTRLVDLVAEGHAAYKQAAAAEAARLAREEAAKRAARARERARLLSGSPKDIARALVAQRGWSASQFSCLDKLWMKESRWNYRASNPSSGAYGIPQSLPGSKMASAGSDWRTNPATQIKWGLSYISSRYGTPCGAWSHSRSNGWY